MPLRKIRLLFVSTFVASFIVACSSGSEVATLPDIELDSEVPTILEQAPIVDLGETVSSRTEFIVRYSKLLDTRSIEANVKLYARKGRDVFSNTDFTTSLNGVSELDQRDIKYVADEYLITTSGEATGNVDQERLATELRIFPDTRFSLASDYAIEVGQSVKDLSPISSVDPVTGLKTTGNFLVGPLVKAFKTDDGEWRPPEQVNDDGGPAGSVISATGVASLKTESLLLWLESTLDDNGNTVEIMLAGGLQHESQSVIGNELRVDYDAAIDLSTSTIKNNVSSFKVAESGDHGCVVWVNKDNSSNPATFSLLSRCFNAYDSFGERLDLGVDISGGLNSLNARLTANGKLLVTYVRQAVLKGHILDLNSENLSLKMDKTFELGSLSEEVLSYALDDSNVIQTVDQLPLVVSYNHPSSIPSAAFSVKQWSVDLSSGVPEFVALVESGSIEYTKMSFGLDYLGRGFLGWITGNGNERAFYTARFDGVFWEQPIAVFKDGRGPISDAGIKVFYEGQAVFYWVQEVNGIVSLRAQGYFQAGGVSAFSRPPWILLDSVVSAPERFGFIPDREGNGTLYYVDSGSLKTLRFLHNRVWEEAWGGSEFIANGTFGSSVTLKLIKEDGRMMALTVDKTSQPSDTLNLRMFSDVE